MTHENVRSHHPIKEYVPQALQGAAHLIVAEDAPYNLGQHRTIPTLRLKHRSGGSPRQEPPQAAVALRSASLRLGVRHGICVAKMLDNVGLRYPHRASGAKAPRTLRPLPLLRFAVSATGGAHLCSIQYYLRFWLSSCRTSLAVSALRIMRFCPSTKMHLPTRTGAFLYRIIVHISRNGNCMAPMCCRRQNRDRPR